MFSGQSEQLMGVSILTACACMASSQDLALTAGISLPRNSVLMELEERWLFLGCL